MGRFEHNCNFFEAIKPVHERINAALKAIVPEYYKFLEDTLQCIRTKKACRVAHEAITSLYPSHSILVNRQTPQHRDRRNHPQVIDTLLLCGDFVNGRFFVPELNLSCPYNPGTFIMFRGGALLHRVGDWEGERRICLASYLHQSVVQEMSFVAPRKLGYPLKIPNLRMNQGPKDIF